MDVTYPASPYQRWLTMTTAGREGLQAEGVIDVTGCPDAELLGAAVEQVVSRHGALRTRISTVAAAPFAVQVVTDGPPGRAASTGIPFGVEISELAAGTHRMTMRMPASVLDAASFAIVARELAVIAGGRALEPDPVQFAEFSDWRNEIAGDAVPWVPAVPPRAPFTVHRASEALTPRLHQAVAAVASAAGATFSDVLLTAWLAYLWRFEPERACTVRAADDIRGADPELRDVVGRVTAYLPVTVTFGRGVPFIEAVGLVGEARSAAAEAGERAVAGPAGATPGAAAFDASPAGQRHSAGGVTAGLMAADARTEPFSRRLTWSPGTGELALELDAAGLPPAAPARVLGGLIALADAATASPATMLGRLPVLGAAEAAWLARASQGSARPVGETAIARIAGIARANPGQLAVRDRGTRLTYGELLERAGQVAGALARQGVRRGDAVVVVCDRSVWSVAAILGVMLAGAAYVPVDEGMPQARLAGLIADCGARVTLAREGTELPTAARADPATAASPAGAPALRRTLDDTAYILYTSGSTGRPKGVVVSDRGLANYIGWAVEHYHLADPGEAVVSSPLGFDLTVTTLLAPLTAGGTVVMAQNSSPLDVLTDLSPERNVSVLKLTPRHLDLLASRLSAGQIGRVGTVVVGGEPLSRSVVDRWMSLCGGDSRVVNEYGPTETVVGSSFHYLPPDGAGRPDVPIGLPIANTALHVLDRTLQPVPCGMTGELFIAGAGVARGYLGAPAQTAERFVPNPFADDGMPMYRTGDLVRRDHDGALTFIGRADDQLKIRGFRVEPAEVEQALVAAGGVRAAAVVPSGQALVAFIVQDDSGPDDAGKDDTAILRRVAAALPDYMVPARVVQVRELPLTTNGKVDRAALSKDARSSAAAQPPVTELERLVDEVWRAVLEADRVGLDESFFEVGGDSLHAIEVMRLLQERLGRKLGAVMLFEHPTVRRLADALASPSGAGDAVEAGADRAARRAAARAAAHARRQP
jgi:nonribosomal peptide synthetase protein BlmX